jgi:5-methylcytosine-specific restriction endonuclease McrA
MTKKLKEYAFVLDVNGKKLSPTNINKAWILIRKQKAILKSKYPIIIQLKREIKDDKEDESEFVIGIDDGSKYIGIAIVQKCKTKNKVIFKGAIEQRKDVKHLMDVRRGYRKYHRQHKRYRKTRFNNRSSSKRLGRLAPSIKQKKDAILRVVNKLNRWCKIDKIVLEDVQINIRALQDGKIYRWQYQKSNRLDENLRIATLMRDNYTCQECGKTNCKLEAHHITPQRLGGNNSIYNLITLCTKCHDGIKGKEILYSEKYYQTIKGKNINFKDAQHVMQGKNYLRNELNKVASVELITGSETANKRIDWNIEKSHSNDAIVICGLIPDSCDIKEWIIKPMRRQSKVKTDNVLGIKHRDLVSYIFKNGEKHTGYVTALYPKLNALNFQSPTKHCKKVNAKKCKLIWKYNKIYWLCA